MRTITRKAGVQKDEAEEILNQHREVGDYFAYLPYETNKP